MFPNLGSRLKSRIDHRIPKGHTREVLTGGSIAFIYRLGSMIASYAIMWFIARNLGQVGIGVFNLSTAILGILVMIGCLGFNTSVVRFVAQYNSTDKFYFINHLYKGMLKLTVPLSIGLGLICVFLAKFIAIYIYKDTLFITPFRIIGFTLPFLVLSTINVEFIRGLKVIQVSEFFRNLSIQIVTLIGVIITITFYPSNNIPLLFYMLGAIFAMAYTTHYILRFFRSNVNNDVSIRVSEGEFSLSEHLLISIPMIVTSFVQLLNGKVGTIMIGVFRDTAVVGVFSVAFKISAIVNFVIGALKTIAMPKISELFWQNKMKELNVVLQYSTRLIFYFSLPISIILFFFPHFILGLLKPEFAIGSTTLRIFAGAQLLNAFSGMVAIFLNMTGNQKYFTKIVIISTVLNILLNIILIPKFGMVGAAIGSTVGIVYWNIAGAIYIYRKYRLVTFYYPKFLGFLFKNTRS